MLNLMFFIKSLALTALIVMACQVRIDNSTIEDHATSMIRTSSLIQPLQEVAEGGVKVIRNSIQWISAQVNRQMAKRKRANSAGTESSKNFEFRRSEAFERSQSKSSATGKMADDRNEN